MSVDLWKTLRIWIDARGSERVNATCDLLLITTSDIPVASAAWHLQATPRNTKRAKSLLTTAAKNSTNKDTAKARVAFQKLTSSQALELLEQVVVCGSAPSMSATREELCRELHFLAKREQIDSLLDNIEGWFFRRAIDLMEGKSTSPITKPELDSVVREKARQFSDDELPINDRIAGLVCEEEELKEKGTQLFLRQLEAAGCTPSQMLRALRDYMRAYTQRAEWVRNEMIIDDELRSYEGRLADEWDREFDDLMANAEDASDEELLEKARSLVRWADRHHIPIRHTVVEKFICRGSLQMLADERCDGVPRIGWHRDFRLLFGPPSEKQQ